MSTGETLMTTINCNKRLAIIQRHNKVCTLKCSYMYKYPPGYVTAVKRPEYIRIYYNDTGLEPSVMYNRQGAGTLDQCKNKTLSGKFVVKEIRINYPCLHNWFGGVAATWRDMKILGLAELNVYHTNITGGANLMVSQPIILELQNLPKEAIKAMEKAKIFKNSEQIDTIIDKLAKSGDRYYLSDEFDLNKLIPNEPYYSYVAPEPTLPTDTRSCGNCMNHVVFPLWDSGGWAHNTIVLDKDRTETFLNLLNTPDEKDLLTNMKPKDYSPNNPIYDAIGYMYNKDGPSQKSLSDTDIWIECNPTGYDGEILIKEKKSDIMNIINIPVISILTKENLIKALIIGLFIVITFAVTMFIIYIIFYHIKKKEHGAAKVAASQP